jgi:hypothetical protein
VKGSEPRFHFLASWLAAADPLIQEIRTAPIVWVAGERPREGEG